MVPEAWPRQTVPGERLLGPPPRAAPRLFAQLTLPRPRRSGEWLLPLPPAAASVEELVLQGAMLHARCPVAAAAASAADAAAGWPFGSSATPDKTRLGLLSGCIWDSGPCRSSSSTSTPGIPSRTQLGGGSRLETAQAQLLFLEALSAASSSWHCLSACSTSRRPA